MIAIPQREFVTASGASRTGTVHIVSADPRGRRLLRQMLYALGHAVRSFADAESFRDQGLGLRPDCVVLDSALPGEAALELQRLAQQAPVRMPVVFVAGAQASVTTAVQAMKRGAIDFLCGDVTSSDLSSAVDAAIAVADRWQAEDVRRIRAQALAGRLTPRERAVFALVLEGKLNKQIAAQLDSQEATVKVHRSRLMRKLEVRTLAELLDLGRALGQEHVAACLHLQVVSPDVRAVRSPAAYITGPRLYRNGQAA
ncbi:MAG: LuxR C-terminal-related transcriptional regulator [Burkholderiales bacterium]